MRQQKTTLLKKAMLKALEKTLGNVTNSAKLASIERTSHYRWMADDEKYKAAVESISEITIDFVESKLHNLIEEKNPTSIIFFLKTKAKHRGYIERTETEQIGSSKIIFQNASEMFEFDENGESLEK